MKMASALPLRQRAEYTHKANSKSGRHGWLRLTPAYSVKVVENILGTYNRPLRVLDPFCGTATTALSAAYHGHAAVTADINPFLVWLGQAKTAHYSQNDIQQTLDACNSVLALMDGNPRADEGLPPIHNIERWWSPEALAFLAALRDAIEVATERGSKAQTLLQVAFCRTLIAFSNAAFNHQSMSFKTNHQLSFSGIADMHASYAADVDFVVRGAAGNPDGEAVVLLSDSRDVSNSLSGRFDCVITSPPYVNRMSYIRELRPYMYWLGWLQNGREAGELDWKAIGGTWGIATSRLHDWKPDSNSFQSEQLTACLHRVARADNKNGVLLSRYVAKYFDDIWLHFQGLTGLLAEGCELHYIVGNSTFYGTLLSAEKFYAEMLSRLGFTQIKCTPIRKRNSKKELIEFDITARWRG